MSRAVFLKNTKSPRWLSPHYSPDLVPCTFWLFPKLKSPLKGKRFQTVDEIQENMTGQLMAIPTEDSAVFWTVEETPGELCEVPRCLLWRGLRCHYPMYDVSYIFFNKCLFFILHGWIPSGQTIYTYIDTDIYLFIYFLHPKGALTNYIK